MTPKFCRDCKWFAPVKDRPLYYGYCTRDWVSLISGENVTSYRMAKESRRDYCGVTGEGWEGKDADEEQRKERFMDAMRKPL